MQPVILCTCSANDEDFCLRQKYCHCIAAAGGIPLIVPAITVASSRLADIADALLLSGGGDASPALYAEEKSIFCGCPDEVRDVFEMELINAFHARQKPILGICRGMQMLNIAFGGSLYQDLSEMPAAACHMQSAPKCCPTHDIRVYGKMRELFGESLQVNSFHHQGVKRLGSNLLCGAESPDGLCECFYAEKGFLCGVQWHPEHLQNAEAHSLFRAFILAAEAK